ncbi:MAG: hypothetical protein M0Z94_01605 [Dehalococcoidales bacterium]|nr:hypothetical protein [Dehalococcoidales bacterium]
MPGDEVVARPTFNATRAVTVEARPEAIWPWLVQIGCQRAGWYSYDLVDNLGSPSAERIIPELQHLEVGDLVPMSPDGKQGLWVKALEPNRWMLWGDDKGDTSWFWGLFPMDRGRTRLITRVRMRYNWLSPWILFNLLLDVGDVVMMRKCMLGIKRRAEAITERWSTWLRTRWPSAQVGCGTAAPTPGRSPDCGLVAFEMVAAPEPGGRWANPFQIPVRSRKRA